MTDHDQTPDKEEAPEAPQQGAVPPLDGTVSPESAADTLDKTVEVPKVDPDLQETAVLTQVQVEHSEPAVDKAAVASEQEATAPVAVVDDLEATAVNPQVGPLPVPADTSPAPEPVPQPAIALAAPPSETAVTAIEPPATTTDQSIGDTTDFTLSDITLSDAGGVGLAGWLRNLRLRLTPAKAAPAPSALPAGRTKHWGLRTWQWVLVGIGALVFVVGVLIAVDAGLYYDRVHYGVKVAGQDLGGMTSARATGDLTTAAEDAQKQAITLESEGHSWQVLPNDLGTSVDIPATIAEAMALTRKGNVLVDLAAKIRLYYRGEDLALEGVVDSAKMDALLARVATALDVPAIDAAITMNNGTVEIIDGKQGTVVDQDALRASLTQLLLTLQTAELAIPLVTTEPALTREAIEPALAQVSVMIGSDLVLTSKGETIATLTPAEMITYLDMTSKQGGSTTSTVETAPVLSASKMTTLFDSLDKTVSIPGVNATLSIDTETKSITGIVEGTDGQVIDREATAAALTAAAEGDETERTAEVVMKSVPPDITAADAEAMGIKDLLADYKTPFYVGTKDRQKNVRLATQLCSGVFLAPGEEFNTDQRLGVRDAAHGWALAPGITGPGKLEDVFGGGICQVSTTLFNAVLLAGLEITKRYNHSIYINHYPSGRDATVTAGGKNMCFRNDTDHYIYIHGWSTGINTHFYIFGVNDGRQVQPIGFSGFSIGPMYPTQTIINKSLPVGATKEAFPGQRWRTCSITRTVIYADGTTKSETWASKWSEMPQVIETNPPATTTTVSAATTTTTGP